MSDWPFLVLYYYAYFSHRMNINLALLHERIDQIRLVDINVTVLDDLFETLNAYRIFHDQAIFYVLTDKDIKTFRQGNAMDSPASIRTIPASVTPLRHKALRHRGVTDAGVVRE